MSARIEHDAARSSRITAIADARLTSTSHSALRKVFCKFDKGVLVLKGRLNSFFHSQLAQEAVAGIEGVEQVVNEIQVIGRGKRSGSGPLPPIS